MSRPAFRHKSAEIFVAALFFALGALVMWDSVRLGARWAEDGPQAGYFPFYIGLLVCIASAANMASAFFLRGGQNRTFVETHQLALVLVVLVPAAVYVGLIGWLGIYVASALYIGFFMRWLGKYPWWKVAAVSVGTSAAFFLIFEVWFLVPLPKGPLESALGLG
ncbi:MAG TPA: tripartite tricarboxylate transporter TctB family protein [Burkholderiales bacterium]|nr:tripartite tricarboxylate transporter TctB family protein [Burkholderiales bacterium]